MEEIVPGVHRVGFGYVSAFLVAGERMTLVDAGVPKRGPKLNGAISEAGRGAPLGDVLVTHHHVDHVGSLDAVAPAGVTVWAHPLDARVIRGEIPPPHPATRSFLDRAGVKLVERLGPKRTPGRVDREVADGEQIPAGEGFLVFHTPGHTAGHVSFLYPSRRILFVGDAAANTLGRLGPPLGLYSENHEEVKQSIAKLAALDFDIACFGHGRVLKGEACLKFRRLAEKVAG